MICHSDAGNGPLTASKALEEALHIICENDKVEVSTVDVLRETNRIGFSIVNLYNYLLSKNLIWNTLGLQLFYNSSLIKSGAFLSFSLKSIIQLLEKEKPKAVIFTNPWIIGYVMTAIKKLLSAKPKIISVVIDLGQPLPPSWFHRDIDLFITPTEEAKKELSKFGALDQNVKVLGMPILPKFLKNLDRKGIHETLRTSSCNQCFDKLHILIMGGRSGTQNTFWIVKHLMESNVPLHLTILCGINRKLKYKVENYLFRLSKNPLCITTIDNRKHAIVHGFVPDVYIHMLATDLIVTKPGALTISEAIHLGVPLILDTYPVVMGQEVGNVKYVESRGFGLVARKPSEVTTLVERFFKDKDFRAELNSNTEASTNLGGTIKIAQFIVDTIREHPDSLGNFSNIKGIDRV
jgi:UDP-N-acetylglucosamine:LPS N-acetylglucosamine transferase